MNFSLLRCGRGFPAPVSARSHRPAGRAGLTRCGARPPARSPAPPGCRRRPGRRPLRAGDAAEVSAVLRARAASEQGSSVSAWGLPVPTEGGEGPNFRPGTRAEPRRRVRVRRRVRRASRAGGPRTRRLGARREPRSPRGCAGGFPPPSSRGPTGAWRADGPPPPGGGGGGVRALAWHEQAHTWREKPPPGLPRTQEGRGRKPARRQGGGGGASQPRGLRRRPPTQPGCAHSPPRFILAGFSSARNFSVTPRIGSFAASSTCAHHDAARPCAAPHAAAPRRAAPHAPRATPSASMAADCASLIF